jgi:pimeloyl-ACP methyl ester carboxylesterase
MGGGVGALAAGALPSRITRLVAIEGLGPLTSPPGEAPERMGRYIVEHRAWEEGRAARPYATREEAIEARMSQPQAPLTRYAAETLAKRGLQEVEGAFRWRHDPRVRLTSMLRLTEEHVLAFLGRIRCPVLAISAVAGWSHDREAGRKRFASIADVRVLQRPGEHHIHLNTPEVIADDIAGFLVGD